jgi:peptidoglycan/LPS O-acetylase OafA/YrhL
MFRVNIVPLRLLFSIVTHSTASPSPSGFSFRGHIPALDGIRGLAILLVMVSHFLIPELFQDNTHYRILQLGWLGVDMFFVLSGFLITGILIDTKDRKGYWSTFIRRRAVRIFPLYYFSVVVVWLTVLFIEKAPERLQGYDSFKWFFGFAPNIAMALKDNWLYHSHVFSLNHLWSVAIEEQFYLLWPLIVYWLPRRGVLLLCAALVAFSTSIRLSTDAHFGHEWTLAAYMLPWCRMDGLATGGFLAVFFRLGWHHYLPFARTLMRILVIGAAVLLVRQAMYGSAQTIATISALGFGGLLYLALNPHPLALVRRLCEYPLLMHFGKYSYGLYVFHEMFKYAWMKGFGEWLMHSGWPAWLAQVVFILLAGLGSYILARLSWRWIEAPFLRWK